MTPEVEIYDTTLRDGTRPRHFVLGRRQAAIADRLDAFGVHTSRAAGPLEPEGHRILRGGEAPHLQERAAAAFGRRAARTSARGRRPGQLLIAAATPVVTIFGKTSPLHVREVLQTTLDENVAMMPTPSAF